MTRLTYLSMPINRRISAGGLDVQEDGSSGLMVQFQSSLDGSGDGIDPEQTVRISGVDRVTYTAVASYKE